MQAEQGTLGAKLAIIRGALTLVGRQVDRVGARFLLDQELDKNLDGDEDGSAQQALSHKQWPWDWKLLAASREKRDGERHHCTILSRAEVVQAAAFLQEQQGDGDGRTETSSGDASDAEAVLAAARVFIGTRTVVGRGRCCSEHKKETLVCWPDLLSPPPPTHPPHPPDWFPIGIGSTRRRSAADPFAIFEVVAFPRAAEFRRAVLGRSRGAAAAAPATSCLHITLGFHVKDVHDASKGLDCLNQGLLAARQDSTPSPEHLLTAAQVLLRRKGFSGGKGKAEQVEIQLEEEVLDALGISMLLDAADVLTQAEGRDTSLEARRLTSATFADLNICRCRLAARERDDLTVTSAAGRIVERFVEAHVGSGNGEQDDSAWKDDAFRQKAAAEALKDARLIRPEHLAIALSFQGAALVGLSGNKPTLALELLRSALKVELGLDARSKEKPPAAKRRRKVRKAIAACEGLLACSGDTGGFGGGGGRMGGGGGERKKGRLRERKREREKERKKERKKERERERKRERQSLTPHAQLEHLRKFPRTAHIFDAAEGAPELKKKRTRGKRPKKTAVTRDDLLLSQRQLEAFCRDGCVVVAEEKIDGANLGFSIDASTGRVVGFTFRQSKATQGESEP